MDEEVVEEKIGGRISLRWVLVEQYCSWFSSLKITLRDDIWNANMYPVLYYTILKYSRFCT